jgi:hypothetical protein
VERVLEAAARCGRALVDSWIWPHIVTAWHAAPIMAKQKSGLIVEVVEQPGSSTTASSSST